MAPRRDSRGRFARGCTHSRNYRTGSCRSGRAHTQRVRSIRAKGDAERRQRALQTVGRRVQKLRQKNEYEDYVDYSSYVPFDSSYVPFSASPRRGR